jgi:hypothetical protein
LTHLRNALNKNTPQRAFRTVTKQRTRRKYPPKDCPRRTKNPIATALKLDATAATAAAGDWLNKDTAAEAARTAAAAAFKALQQQSQPSEDAARAFVRLLKATPGVTPAMLETLHCVGPDTDPQARVGAERPDLRLSLEGGQVVVKFAKNGHQGILLHCRRGAETEFTLLGLDTHSPYVDTRPNLIPGQAEDRHYRAYFADRDHAVGDLSDVATIAVRG